MPNIFEGHAITVLSTDLVGYRRMVAGDAEATAAAISFIENRVGKSVAAFEGRVFMRAGEGFLIEFATTEAALNCAFDLQANLRMRNRSVEAARRIQLRFGLDRGEPIAHQNKLQGEVVDIAVRLQEMAAPGHAVVSKSVREELSDRSDLDFMSIGRMRLKNVPTPIEAFDLKLKHRNFEQDLEEPLDMDTNDPVSGFEGRSAVAVFPLENSSRTGEHDYVPDVFGDSLTVALSHMRQFPVIGNGSSYALIQSGLSQSEAAAHLGARYIVAGVFSDHGAQYRLSLQLTDSTNGESLWSDSYLMGPDGLEAGLEEVCVRAAGTLEGQLEQAEAIYARTSKLSRSSALSLVWRGRWHLNRLTLEDSIEAKTHFEAALEQDPDNSEALIQMGYWYWLDCWTKRKSRNTIEAFRAIADRAMRSNPHDSRGHFLIGAAEILLKRHATALEHFEQSLLLNPSHAHAHSQIGSCHMLMGQPALAIEHLRTSLRLNSQDYYLFATLGELACAYSMIGEYERAIYLARRALGLRPSYWHASMTLITALMRSGEEARAVEELNLLLTRHPEFFERAYIDWLPFEDKKRRLFFEKSLKDARKQMRKRDSANGPSGRTQSQSNSG